MYGRTPSTEEVRAAWAWSIVGAEPHAEAEFDRWYAERIDEAKAEQREADADVERLADMLHRAMTYQYDECDHGTYAGGANHGEPYKMCEIFARRVSAELRGE